MATYMVTWHLPGDTRNEAISRFVRGDAMEPPAGITHVARWHAVTGDAGFGVLETDDPKHIADWVLSWNDIISYEVFPVISDEELGDLFQKHGLG